jgi:hypothetical protein
MVVVEHTPVYQRQVQEVKQCSLCFWLFPYCKLPVDKKKTGL